MLKCWKKFEFDQGNYHISGQERKRGFQMPEWSYSKMESSNSKVVSVSQKGVIRAKKAGEAVITLKCGNTVCKLKVYVNSKKFLSKGNNLKRELMHFIKNMQKHQV